MVCRGGGVRTGVSAIGQRNGPIGRSCRNCFFMCELRTTTYGDFNRSSGLSPVHPGGSGGSTHSNTCRASSGDALTQPCDFETPKRSCQ